MRDDSFVLTSPVQVFYWILSPGDLNHVFLAFFGHFHHIKVRRVHLLISITRPIRLSPRVYAISSKNKLLAVYLGTLASAKFIVTLASSFIRPPVIVMFPPLPVDAAKLCGYVMDFKFKLVPHSIGTTFGTHLLVRS